MVGKSNRAFNSCSKKHLPLTGVQPYTSLVGPFPPGYPKKVYLKDFMRQALAGGSTLQQLAKHRFVFTHK